MKKKHLLYAASFPITAVVVSGTLLFTGCKKKDEQGGGITKSITSTVSKSISALAGIDQTLLGSLPKDSYGIYYANFNSDAMKSVMSIYGDSSSNKTLMNQEGVKKVADKLKEFGIDVTDPLFIQKSIQELSGYVKPPQAAGQVPGFGLNINFNSNVKLDALFDYLKQEIAGEGSNKSRMTDETVEGGKGFKLTSPTNEPEGKVLEGLYLGMKGKGLSLSTDPTSYKNALGGTKAQPEIISSKEFETKTAALGTALGKDTLLYLDMVKLFADISQVQGAPEEMKSILKSSPFKAVTSSAATSNGAQLTKIALWHDKSARVDDKWISKLSASSSKDLIGAVSEKTMMFFSLDGTTIKNVKAAILPMAGEKKAMIETQIAFLDGIKRIGFAFRMPAAGQSMLNLPELLILVQSTDSKKFIADVKNLTTELSKDSGAPIPPWQESDLEGIKLNSIATPMGVGAYMTDSKGLVVIASSEGQLKASIAAQTGKVAQPTSLSELAVGESVLDSYISYKEIGDFLGTVGQTLSMFDPGAQQKIDQVMDKGQIEAMKKLGDITSAVRLEPESITMDAKMNLPVVAVAK